MDDRRDSRIPISDFPELAEEIARLLADPERIKATNTHRKTFQRLLKDGMPAYFKPFTLDAELAEALCASLRRAA